MNSQILWNFYTFYIIYIANFSLRIKKKESNSSNLGKFKNAFTLKESLKYKYRKKAFQKSQFTYSKNSIRIHRVDPTTKLLNQSRCSNTPAHFLNKDCIRDRQKQVARLITSRFILRSTLLSTRAGSIFYDGRHSSNDWSMSRLDKRGVGKQWKLIKWPSGALLIIQAIRRGRN